MKYTGRRQNEFIAQGLSSIGVDVKVVLTPPCIFYFVWGTTLYISFVWRITDEGYGAAPERPLSSIGVDGKVILTPSWWLVLYTASLAFIWKIPYKIQPDHFHTVLL